MAVNVFWFANNDTTSLLLAFTSFLNLNAWSTYQLLAFEIGRLFELWLIKFGILGFLRKLLGLSHNLELREVILRG